MWLFENKENFAVFHGVAVLLEDCPYDTTAVGFDLIKNFHRLDNA